jgi:hypothetical protein
MVESTGSIVYTFTNSKNVLCWFSLFSDFSGGLMGRFFIPGRGDPLYLKSESPESGIRMTMPNFAKNATGKYLVAYLGAARNSSERFNPLKVPVHRYLRD